MQIKETVMVLGTEYRIRLRTREEDEELKDCDGYCREHMKLISVRDYTKDTGDTSCEEERQNIVKRCLRHDLVHAFLFESGLGWDSECAEHWAVHEEMVDWFARMEPKIHAAYLEAGCA